MSRSDWRRAVVLVALLSLTALACGPKLSREEEIELVRSQYTAELQSLTVKQDPVLGGVPDNATAADAGAESEAPDVAAEVTGAAVQAADAGTAESASVGAETGSADDVEAAGDETASVRTDVILDILVSTRGQEYLPGITLDVEHVDEERRAKDRRTLWVDTTGLVRGAGTQITHVLENVDWEVGDGFFVEVRTPIPAEERSGYREFQ